MNPKKVLKRRTPLKMLSLGTMVAALLVVALIFSYICGTNLLSRILPTVPEPNHISFHIDFETLIDVIFPLLSLFCILYILSLPLKYVLSQKSYRGFRAEFILIAYSLLIIAFSLQLLEGYVPYAGSLKNSLLPLSLVPILLTTVTTLIAVVYRYFVDEKPQKTKDFLTPISLIVFFMCMAFAAAIFIFEYLQEVLL